MRTLTNASSLLLVTLFACSAVACSVTSTDEEQVPSDEEAASNEERGDREQTGESAAADPAEKPAPAPTDPAAPSDPATPTAPTAPTAPTSPIVAPPGASCAGLEGAVAEVESNDTAETASALEASVGKTTFVCGTIGADTDVDFVTFTLPAETKGFSYKLSYDATKPDVMVTVGARAPVALGGALTFVKGEPYVMQVKGAPGTTYRIGIALK